jgi:membrane fusion protein (multidrug efflux system)
VPGRTFVGEVTRVSPAVDVESRTALLEARVPNREGLLKPGLFARGVIALRKDTGVAFVPEAAVSYFAGITKVFVIEDGTARERAASGLGQLQNGVPVTLAGTGRSATAPR